MENWYVAEVAFIITNLFGNNFPLINDNAYPYGKIKHPYLTPYVKIYDYKPKREKQTIF